MSTFTDEWIKFQLSEDAEKRGRRSFHSIICKCVQTYANSSVLANRKSHLSPEFFNTWQILHENEHTLFSQLLLLEALLQLGCLAID